MMTPTPAPVNPFTDLMDMIDSISLSQGYVMMDVRDNAIIANTEAITNLTTSLTLFINHLDTLTTSGSTISEKGHLFEQKPSSDTGAKPLGVAGIANPTTAIAESVASNTEVLKTISATLKSGADLGESLGLGDKTEKLKKLSEGLNAFGEISDAFDGVKNAKGFLGTLSGLAGVATTVAATAKAIGPQGAAFVTVGAGVKKIWDYSTEEARSQEPQQDKTTFMSPQFLAKYPHLQKIVDNASYSEQLAEWTKHKPVTQLQQERAKYEQRFLADGGELHFNDRLARTDEAYLPAVISAMTRSATMPNNPIKDVLFDTPELQKAFKEYADPLGNIKTRLADKQRVFWTAEHGPYEPLRAKEMYVKNDEYSTYDLMNFIFRIDDRLDDSVKKGLFAYKQNGASYVGNYVQSLSGKFGNIPGSQKAVEEAQARLIRGFNVIEQEKAAAQGQSERVNTVGCNTINFNKSLIEHFTINVKDSREGVRDFKRKVEEVLLEILNSINAN